MLQLRSKETWSLATTRSPSLSFQTKGAEAAVCAMVVGRDHEVVACFQPARSPSWSVSLCLIRPQHRRSSMQTRLVSAPGDS